MILLLKNCLFNKANQQKYGLLLSLILCLGYTSVVNGQISLVKNIYQGKEKNTGSKPASLSLLGNKLFFGATNKQQGRELWMSDGTEAGTQLFKEMMPGSEGGFHEAAVLGNKICIFGNDGTPGVKLWLSDGTQAGTQLVSNFSTTRVASLFTTNNQLYFSVLDAKDFMDLWVTDGTKAGTYQVAKAVYRVFPSFGGKVCFISNESGSKQKLWITDGTQGGEQMLKEGANAVSNLDILNAGLNGLKTVFKGETSSGAVIGNELYFSWDDGVHGHELWKTDGTSAGTQQVKDIRSGKEASWPLGFAVLNNQLIFAAYDKVHGRELWISDGTTTGTQLLKETHKGVIGIGSKNFALVGLSNNKLYFAANDEVQGSGLWVTDGTATGTQQVKSIHPKKLEANLRELKVVGNQLFFTANDGVNGQELWKSDGTETGTQLVNDIYPGEKGSITYDVLDFRQYASIVQGNQLYFKANDGVHGEELWVSDGTKAGTYMLKDIEDKRKSSSPIRYPVKVGNQMYFTTSDKVHGEELWVSNGTTAGTHMIKDINPGEESSHPSNILVMGNRVYFIASNGTGSRGLWVSDGTEAGTQLLKSEKNFTSGLYLGIDHVAMGNQVCFMIDDAVYGRELWITDGTKAGTRLVKDIKPGKAITSTKIYGALGNQLYFMADDGVHGRELWTTDGTEAGTQMVKDISPGAGHGAYLSTEEVIGNQLYFKANDGVNGEKLWISDGTEAGTQMLNAVDLSSGVPGNFVKVGNQVCFSVQQKNDMQLWVTDGTDGGTKLLKKANTGKYVLSYPGLNLLNMVGNQLYFLANSDNNQGYELWVTDGTQAGTQMIKLLNWEVGFFLKWNSSFAASKNQFYFTTNNGTHGHELWVTDGTQAGTQMVKDIHTGLKGSTPSDLVVVNNQLYFFAYTASQGWELWTSDGTASGTLLVQDFYAGVEGMFIGSDQKAFALNNEFLFVENGGLYKSQLFNKINFSPKSGAIGTEVIITGTGLSTTPGNNVVKFNGVEASVTAATATELRVTVPDKAITGKITVETGGVLAISADDFTVETLTHLPDQLSKGQLVLYPNPTVDQLKVRLVNHTTSQIGVTVLNTQGLILQKSQHYLVKGEMSVNLQSLAPGTYLLLIQVGNEQIVKTVIKR